MTKHSESIREEIVSVLTGNTAAGANVYNGRLIPWESVELPLINVISFAEVVNENVAGYGNKHRIRSLDVGVMCAVKGNPGDEILNILDALCEQVESVLNNLPNLNQKVTSFEPTGVEAPQINNDGSQPFAFTTATYNAVYVQQ